MPNSQKGFAPIILIVATVLIAGVIGAFYLQKNSITQPSTQPQLQAQRPNTISFPIPTLPNNKIYRNSKFGFQFEYDKDSDIIYEGGNGVLLKIEYPKDSRSSISDSKLYTGGKFDIEAVSDCNSYVTGTDIRSQVSIDSKSIFVYDSKDSNGRNQYNTSVCLEKNGNSFLLTNLYGPNVFGYDNNAIPKAFIEKAKQFFTQILKSFKFVPVVGLDQTYASENLGINFLYSPVTSTGNKVVINEDGNKVYVYVDGQDKNNADYIEAVNIEDNSTIIDSINKYIVQHFAKDDCFQVYNVQRKYSQGQTWEIACPSPKGSSRHLDYFLYDKNNSKKFIFINIDFKDKYGMISSKNTVPVRTSDYKAWYATVNFSL